MKTLLRALSLIVLVLGCRSAAAQASRLSSGEARSLDQTLATYETADDETRKSIAVSLVRKVDVVRPIIEKRQEKEPTKSHYGALLEAFDKLEGKDLMRRPMKVPSSPWSLWTVPAGEVIVMKADGKWAGLRVDPKIDLKAGRITVHVATTPDPLRQLGGDGIERSTQQVEGTAVPLTTTASRAYDQRDYSFNVLGHPVVLRSVGTEAFRWKHEEGGPPVARSGQKDFRGVKPSDPKLVWRDKADADIPVNCRRVQQYCFRIVGNIRPLPTYDTPDESKYADKESVQVDIREDPSGQKVLIVSFPNDDEFVFEPDEAWLLGRFSETLCGIKPANVLVWRGTNEAHEVNPFWTGKEWAVPKGDLVQKIRKLYPEDY